MSDMRTSPGFLVSGTAAMTMAALLVLSPGIATTSQGQTLASNKGTELTREEATSIPAIDLEKLNEREPSMAGKIVRLKFNYRSTSYETLADGTINGRLYIFRSSSGAGNDYRYGNRSVHVPKEGVEWFTKISAKESRGSQLVYARLTGSPDKPAELLGREIKNSLTGSRIEW